MIPKNIRKEKIFKSFVHQDTIKKMKKITEWEKILMNHISNKRFVFRIYKELLQHNSKKKSNSIKKMSKRLE